MTLYTIRPNFTIAINGVTYAGGQQVELDETGYQLNKHKLEGSGRSVEPIVVEDECCFPPPYFSSVEPFLIPIDRQSVLTITGSFFTPDSEVIIDGVKIDNIEFVSSNEILVTVTALSGQSERKIVLDNGKKLTVLGAIDFFDIEANTIDLRSGGTSFSDAAIEIRDGMSWSRTPEGLRTNGGSGWGRWVRLVGDNEEWVWNRDEKRNIALIAKSNQAMFGIGSYATNPNSSAQYREAEIVAYVSSLNFFGFYGNDGNVGSYARSEADANFSNEAIIKLVLTSNGEGGSDYSLFELKDANLENWHDTANLIVKGKINSTMTANQSVIMPFFIPNNNNFRLLGFYFF